MTPRRWTRFATLALTLLANAAFADPVPRVLDAPPGKPVYVDFWASWCTPCAQSFPWLNTVQARFGSDIYVVGVNVDEHKSDAARFLQRHPARFALHYDPKGELATRYQLQGMPSAVLLSPDGKVLWQHSGFRAEEIPDYEAAILSALK
jgi:cytochrome c biogenesis protein CcmG, thiol:disulfide interchange protein DsbE